VEIKSGHWPRKQASNEWEHGKQTARILHATPAFAAGYRYWRRMMDAVESLEVWKASRRLANRAAQIVRVRWLQLKRAQASYWLQ
jgi:hypothetical protein